MTPETAVERLAEILGTQAELDEDQIYVAMAEAGIPDRTADLAYKFTQFAWGRVALDGLGTEFSPEYLCFNGVGEIIESGLLADQPYFVAAKKLATPTLQAAGWIRFAFMSAEVLALNDALKAGSKPENLIAAPAAMFFEPATPQGLRAAEQILSKRTGCRTVDAHNGLKKKTWSARMLSSIRRWLGAGG